LKFPLLSYILEGVLVFSLGESFLQKLVYLPLIERVPPRRFFVESGLTSLRLFLAVVVATTCPTMRSPLPSDSPTPIRGCVARSATVLQKQMPGVTHPESHLGRRSFNLCRFLHSPFTKSACRFFCLFSEGLFMICISLLHSLHALYAFYSSRLDSWNGVVHSDFRHYYSPRFPPFS